MYLSKNIYIYIYIYILRGGVCDLRFHALRIHQTASSMKHKVTDNTIYIYIYIYIYSGVCDLFFHVLQYIYIYIYICVCVYVCVFIKPSAGTGCDTRSMF